MKTLTINRPEGLALACRQYRFTHKETGIDLRELDKPTIKRLLNRHLAYHQDTYTHDCALAILGFLDEGAQLCIDKELSIDLEASSVCGDLCSLVWPAPVLHVVFEDPSLPSLIAQKRFNVSQDPEGLLVDVCLKDGSNGGVLLGSSDWRGYSEGRLDISAPPQVADALSTDEREAIRYMASLFAKALAYASIPHHAPTRLTTRAEKKHAGIHPNQQTRNPTLLLRHLPRIVKDPVMASGDTGLEHRFMGRAGHLRHYQAERYKNMKGQWQWIPPIPPPEGIKVVYKVRKVAA